MQRKDGPKQLAIIIAVIVLLVGALIIVNHMAERGNAQNVHIEKDED